MKISAVINTWNEEGNLPRALASVRGWVDEIVVCDMESTDKTVEIAKRVGARVFSHEYTAYVEPARNFAVSKAKGDWVLVLDADEEVPEELAKDLRKLAEKGEADYYRLPRKNIIFGKWMKHSRWWPDYNIRFFKKGRVVWSEVIHSVPETRGRGADLDVGEKNAILHHHYVSVEQFMERMNRYTTVQASLRVREGYKFSWQKAVMAAVGEFFSRFFEGRGYKDGFHGLTLAVLQGVSEWVVNLKVWQLTEEFGEHEVSGGRMRDLWRKMKKGFCYWQASREMEEGSWGKRVAARVRRKLSS